MKAALSSVPRRATQAGALLIAIIVFVAINQRPGITAVGPVSHLIETDTGLSISALGVLASVAVVGMGVASLVGPLMLRYRSMNGITADALICISVSIAVRSFVPGVWLWVGTAGIGFGIGILNTVIPAIIKRDFPLRSATVTGIYSATLTLGAGISSGVAVPIAGATSWRVATGVWLALSLAAFVAWFIARRTILAPDAPLRRRPSQPTAAQTVAEVLKEEGDDDAARRVLATEPEEAPSVRSVWRSPVAWAVTCFMGFQSLMFYMTMQWLPSIEIERGVSSSAAGFHLFLFQVAGLVTTLTITAVMRERRDQRIVAFSAPICFIVTAVGLMVAPSLAGLWVFLGGIGSGGSFQTAISFINTRSRNAREASHLSGMSQSLGYFIAAVGPTLAGSLAAMTGSWMSVLWLMVVMSVINGCIGLYAGRDVYV